MAGWQYWALEQWQARRVVLDWNDNTEPDLAYYNVYRSTTSGSGFSLLATNVLTSTYTDTTVDLTTVYYYRVTAVDTNGNESGNSSEVASDAVVAQPIRLVGMVGIRGAD